MWYYSKLSEGENSYWTPKSSEEDESGFWQILINTPKTERDYFKYLSKTGCLFAWFVFDRITEVDTTVKFDVYKYLVNVFAIRNSRKLVLKTEGMYNCNWIL